MAYSRVPLMCADYPLGIQTVNQIQENMAVMDTQLSVSHGEQVNGNMDSPWDSLGKHNAAFFPKAVLYCQYLPVVSTSGLGDGSLGGYLCQTTNPIVGTQNIYILEPGVVLVYTFPTVLTNISVIGSMCVTSAKADFSSRGGISATRDNTSLLSPVVMFIRHGLFGGEQATVVRFFDVTTTPWTPAFASFTLSYYGDFV